MRRALLVALVGACGRVGFDRGPIGDGGNDPPIPPVSGTHAAYIAGGELRHVVRDGTGWSVPWTSGAVAPAAQIALLRASGNRLYAAVVAPGSNLEVRAIGDRVASTSMAIAIDPSVQRNFDLAIESTSGEPIVVGVDRGVIVYCVRIGDAWSVVAPVDTLATITGAAWIALYERPDNDEIALVIVTSDGTLHATVWNGDAWVQEFSTLGQLELGERMNFDGVYTIGGRFALVYGVVGSDPALVVREPGLLAFGVPMPIVVDQTSNTVEVALDPINGRVAMAFAETTFGTGNDIAGAVWDGTAIADNVVLETDSADLDALAGAHPLAFTWANGTAILFSSSNVGTTQSEPWSVAGGWIGATETMLAETSVAFAPTADDLGMFAVTDAGELFEIEIATGQPRMLATGVPLGRAIASARVP